MKDEPLNKRINPRTRKYKREFTTMYIEAQTYTYIRMYIEAQTYIYSHRHTYRGTDIQYPSSDQQSFFLFFPCNHIINIKKIFFFFRRSKRQRNFSLLFLLHKRAKPALPPYPDSPPIPLTAHPPTHPPIPSTLEPDHPPIPPPTHPPTRA
jgi:hypothetical protein